MAKEGRKNWNRPWSSEEIIKNAENWSLAGDAALLNTLKAFADNLLTKTGAINEKIDSLLNNLNEASVKLDLSQNEFQSLKHTQFIESRVYEDDETLDSVDNKKAEEKPITEEEQEKWIVDSIKTGMEILNDYYDKVEISISDSEEETERSYTLKPKDIYEHRPLPPIIGTPDWEKKWYLEDITSESESDKQSETYSESDSEDNLPKDLMKGSETSSELDFSSHVSETRPMAHSSAHDTIRKPELMTSSEESDDQMSIPVKTPLSNKSFAEQLAAKLDNVISQQEEIPPEVNRKRIQPVKSNTFTDGLFNNEPPPIDNSEDSALEKDNNSGLFSGGKGLFDDNEDDSFWTQHNNIAEPQIKKKLFDDEEKTEELPPPLKTSQKSGNIPKSFQVSKGLFDSDESSDDDIFSAGRKTISKPSFLLPNKPIPPLFDEEPPILEEKKPVIEEPKIKKLAGAVKIMGPKDLFGDKKITDILNKSKRQTEAPSGYKDPETETKTIVDISKVNKTVGRRKNLFNQDDDDNDEVVTKPKDENMFKSKKLDISTDTVKTIPEKDENIAKNKVSQVFPEETTDSISKDDKGGKETHKPKKISLFDDDEENVKEKFKKPKKISLFDDDDDDIFKDDIFSDITSKKSGLKLFDDLESSVDLFSNRKETSNKDTEQNLEKYAENNTNDTNIETVDASVALKTNDSLTKKLLNEKKGLRLFSDSSDDDQSSNKSDSFEASDKNTSVIKKDNTELYLEPDTAKSTIDPIEVEPKKTVTAENRPPILEKKQFKGLFSDSEEEEDDIFHIKTKQSPTDVIENVKVESHTDDVLTKEILEEDVNVPQENSEIVKTELLSISEIDDSVSDMKTVDLEGNNKFESTAVSEKGIAEDSNSPTDYTNSTNKFNGPDINIFASSPPPDDGDDWETKSDSLSENEDFLSYRTDNNSERMDVFDNEPPLLEPNDSSGIVKDYNATRVDYFSFYPDASSSRRHSSDIFNDQQSQDSFFVTKTKSDSTKLPSSLDVIPEGSKTSILEITPSGDIKDFDTTTGTSQEPLPSNDQIENITTSINKDVSSKVDKKADDTSVSNNPELPKPVEKSMKNKISLISELLKNKPMTPQSYSQNYTGKVDDTTREASVDSPDNVEVLQCVTKTRAKIPIKRRPSSRRARQEAIRKSAVDLLEGDHFEDFNTEQEADKSIKALPDKSARSQNILETPAKTEEQEADKNQQDFKDALMESIQATESDSKTFDTKQSEINPFTNPTSNTTIEKKESIFNDSFSDDDGLFATTSKKSARTKPKDSLFDTEGDSDNDLFGSLKPPSLIKSGKVETEKVVTPVSKKQLFEDSSSDDDLFSGARTQTTKLEPPKTVINKSKIATTKKLENIKSEDDPLTKLLK